jgi:co-chaperonin GroES (HSP10)
MAIPKSELLKAMESSDNSHMSHIMMPTSNETATQSGPIKIRAIKCLNEWVAILLESNESTIALTDSSKYKNEGVVVGVGNGIIAGDSRLPSQVALGDKVTFRIRDIVEEIMPSTGFYANKKIAMVFERNLISKLPSIEFEIVEE